MFFICVSINTNTVLFVFVELEALRVKPRPACTVPATLLTDILTLVLGEDTMVGAQLLDWHTTHRRAQATTSK